MEWSKVRHGEDAQRVSGDSRYFHRVEWNVEIEAE